MEAMLVYTCIFTDEKFCRLSHTGQMAWLRLAKILDPNWGHAEASLVGAVAHTWPIEQAAAEAGDRVAEAIIEEAKAQLRLAVDLGLLIIDEAEGCPVIAYNQWERYHQKLTRRAAPRDRMSKAIARTRDFSKIGPKSEGSLRDYAERFRLVPEVKRTKDLWTKEVPNQFRTSSEPVLNQCGTSTEPVQNQRGTSSELVPPQGKGKGEWVQGQGKGEEGIAPAPFPTVIRLADKQCPEDVRQALQQVAGLAAVQATRNMGLWLPEVVIPATGGDLPLDIASEVFIAAHCLDLMGQDRSKQRPFYHTRRNAGEVPPGEAVTKARLALGLPPQPGSAAVKAATPKGGHVRDDQGRFCWECLYCGKVWWAVWKHEKPICSQCDSAFGVVDGKRDLTKEHIRIRDTEILIEALAWNEMCDAGRIDEKLRRKLVPPGSQPSPTGGDDD